MSGFIEGEDRHQAILFPESLDEYIADDSAVRVIDVFIDDLDISGLGFKAEPADTGRPGYHPKTMLKLYVYGYLNRVQSSRRLEREAQRNVELMWLTGRLAPDFKTIADFRKDNGIAIRLVCREFVMLCKKLNLLSEKLVAIDGSKVRANTSRHKAMSHGHMVEAEERLEDEIAQILVRMDELNEAEDEEYGDDDGDGGLPAELRDRIRELEAEQLRVG